MIRSLTIPLLFVGATAFANPPETGTQAGDATATTEPSPPKTPAATPEKVALFEDLDANKDGALEKTEVTKVDKLGEQFATVDTDKNGKLSKVEYTAWADKIGEKR